MTGLDSFAARVLSWFDRHGRKDLPWQHAPTPYRVWVSEIMLQQTRVSAVVEYYARFMARFPDLKALAAATEDEVLHLWSGLGYYARARNLHRAAQLVRDRHGGHFPRDFDAIVQLPGIGRSTAGAIMALAFGERHAILDGNVKRVLARFHEIEGWPGLPAVAAQLWSAAEQHTPGPRVADYTQAMMDLGATICVRSRPRCQDCPLHEDCGARRSGRTTLFPHPKPRKQLPVRTARLLLLRNERGAILLERRPPSGIWGGLWSLPECPPDEDIEQWCAIRFGCRVMQTRTWSTLRHTFTHFHFDMVPVVAEVSGDGAAAGEGQEQIWFNAAQPQRLGLAAPVKRLLHTLQLEFEGALV